MRNSTTKRLWGAVGLGLLAGLLLSGMGRATEQDTPQLVRIGRGKSSFRIYCANCHGKDAKGQGAVAKWLKIPPADLTRLSQDNDGEFPTERVRQVIDGREEVRTHGSRDMPIWGEVFQSEDSDEDPEKPAREKIKDFVAFLESIQARDE